MKKAFFSTLLTFLLLTAIGCSRGSFHAKDVPKEVAKVTDLEEGTAASAWQDAASDEQLVSGFEELPPEVPTSIGTATTAEPTASAQSRWNKVIDIAKWVIANEAKKLGNGCNFFIQRVFERLGVGRSSWIANSFDKYVKTNFSTYKARTFNNPSVDVNRANLRNYIWSFPEGTGFVLQWKRRSGHGHVAFVQRIENNLVIYHASMNKFRAKAQKVKVETLLSTSGDNNYLNVFSHFEK